ncbi:protein adenylyltransferase SelO family protein [Amphritea pacifica]|uniref:Protein nucleotidyltransferase YdiU n=1 Tax=Amphritea pacifica TaxID=2811233 RepID=A0ABS2W439_9GAMM|nr:YdiU family protein [Amphritea pacifica]MBN0986182.1 YdiU family protein [Amphritea pacifica]MBN1008759.1 YdiU family protein [Amphritea pacifica]
MMTRSGLDQLQLGNRFAELPASFYTRVQPQPLKNPRLVALSPDAAALIGLDPCQVSEQQLVEYFGGQRLPDGSDPLATVYAGHQFGGYTAQLGDGRALLLGDLPGSDGQRWELQLKGSGKTPYSRHGDGRAALRSVIREYLGSEALAALGVPTTRALCIVGSDTQICRDSIESAASMVRLSPSHIRFGHFEYFYYSRQPDLLKQLADFVIRHHYPHCAEAVNPYLAMYTEVLERTAKLIAQWQALGFCHGVMNTDNMSILGLTLDYGPFAFLDGYQPDFTSNRTDEHGRYAYHQQPSVALWNCVCLAQSLTGLVKQADLESSLSRFESVYVVAYTEQMKQRLGMAGKERQDGALIEGLLQLLQQVNADYHCAFLTLEQAVAGEVEPFIALLGDSPQAGDWLNQYLSRINSDAMIQMKQHNPRVVLRSYLTQQVIEQAGEGDFSGLVKLHDAVRTPFKERSDIYAQPPPEGDKNRSLSCSS